MRRPQSALRWNHTSVSSMVCPGHAMKERPCGRSTNVLSTRTRDEDLRDADLRAGEPQNKLQTKRPACLGGSLLTFLIPRKRSEEDRRQNQTFLLGAFSRPSPAIDDSFNAVAPSSTLSEDSILLPRGGAERTKFLLDILRERGEDRSDERAGPRARPYRRVPASPIVLIVSPSHFVLARAAGAE